MNISSDRFIDWNNVTDMGGKIPSGIVQWRICDFEEKMSSAEGLVEKGDRAGQQKVAKLMYVMHLEGMAPEEAVGLKWSEYFVIGNDNDPLAQNTQTLYDSIGVRQLKNVLGAAQVPWSNSLVSTLSASIGAMYCQQISHKKDRRRDTGEFIAAVITGRTFKVGEIVPQYIPCLLDPNPAENFLGCTMCMTARMAGKGAPVIPAGMPVAGPPKAPVPPVAAPMPVAPVPPAPQPMQPVAPPVMPTAAPPTAAPVNPIPMAPPVNPVPSPPPVAPPGPSMSVPSNVAPAPHPAPVQTPVPAPPQAAPAPAPTGFMNCQVCGQQVAFADYAAHMTAHQAQPAPQFKQET